MKTLSGIGLVLFCLSSKAQLTFTVQSGSGQFSITCYGAPQLTATSNYSAPVNFTWTGPGNFSLTGSTATLSNAGNYSVNASSGTVMASSTLAIGINTVMPVASSGSIITVTSPTMITFTALSPVTNITHFIYTPLGGTDVGTNVQHTYPFSAPGTYTYCLVNNENGCSTCAGNLGGGPFAPGTPGTHTGLAELAADGKLNLTPYGGGIEVSSQETGAVMIYSSDGRLAYKLVLSPANFYTSRIDLTAGLYFVWDEKGNVKKIIVE